MHRIFEQNPTQCSLRPETVYDHDFGHLETNKQCYKTKLDYREIRRQAEWRHAPIYGPDFDNSDKKIPKKTKVRQNSPKDFLNSNKSAASRKSKMIEVEDDEGIELESISGSSRSSSQKSIMSDGMDLMRGGGSVPRLVLNETPSPPRQGGGPMINPEEMIKDRRPLTPPHLFTETKKQKGRPRRKELVEIGTQVSQSLDTESTERDISVSRVSKSTQTPDLWLKKFVNHGRPRLRETSALPAFRVRSLDRMNRKRRSVSSPPWRSKRGPFAQYGMGNQAPLVCDKKTFNVKATGNKFKTAVRAEESKGPIYEFTSLMHQQTDHQEKFAGDTTTAIFDKIQRDKKLSSNRKQRRQKEKSSSSGRKYDDRFMTEYQRAFCKRYELDTFSSLIHSRARRKRVVFD